jgi:glycosyltransferase involved in cell wall biosynthesis
MADSSLPTVSFIVPTLNAERFLKSCLDAIRGQDYPANKIEIIVADAGSTDKTREIAKKYGAKIVENPAILHEPGKTEGTKQATGELLFYTDADNVLANKQWLRLMAAAYTENKEVVGFLPQTTAPPDSSGLNQYLGYLFTDPLTWFIYGAAANPCDYEFRYKPVVKTKNYRLYRFSANDHPLFGLSQGAGVTKDFQRGGKGAADDILSGIQLIERGGLIAYVPEAYVYHYHVEGFGDFIKKYRWRIRNNLNQQVKGMGLVNRLSFFDRQKKLKLYLFVPYALTLVGPIIDAVGLAVGWRSWVMFWHVPASLCLGVLIVIEYGAKLLGLNRHVGTYGK